MGELECNQYNICNQRLPKPVESVVIHIFGLRRLRKPPDQNRNRFNLGTSRFQITEEICWGGSTYLCNSGGAVSLPAQAGRRFVCTAAGLEGPPRLLAAKQGNITNLN